MAAPRRKTSITIVLSVLIAIVIGAIAVPSWRAHQVQNHVAAALTAADGAKLAVMESATVAGSLAKVKSIEVGYRAAATASPYVAQIAIADGGVITVATRATGTTPDPVLTLTPAAAPVNAGAQISWACRLIAGEASDAPAGCAAQAPVASGQTALPSSAAMPAAAGSGG